MALSLSPQQLKQTIHTPLAVQSYYTPRQFTEVVHDKPNHETLSTSQTEQPLHSSRFGHDTHDEDMNKATLPSQGIPDLPSWTPLRTMGDDKGSPIADSEPEVDELLIKTAAVGQTAGKRPMTGGQTSSDAKASKAKKTRFDGVYIAPKPLPHYKNYSSQTRRPPASSARVASLVDALTRTFDANRHTEEHITPPSRATLHHDDASTAPPTDAESTATEAEDDRLRLNTRLAHTVLKRPRVRGRTVNASEISSEDATSLLLPRERPVKRLKPIQYDSNPELIDAALGTTQAPISWISSDGELDIIENEGFVDMAHTAHVASADVHMAVDESARTAGPPGKGYSPQPTPVGRNEWRMPMRENPIKSVFAPYQSRGVKFRQRLDAIFGENAAVRRDRVARPRPADLDISALDEPDRERSPHVSELTVSDHSTSPAEEVTSAVPSTHMTSQSPDMPPADTDIDPVSRNQLNGVDPLTKSAFGASGEQISEWINALQRLVKGKIRVKDEDLELLSIMLAEIESTKESLNDSVPMISELRQSIKQLSELYEIPFGDRNKLRLRAKNILHTWLSTGGTL